MSPQPTRCTFLLQVRAGAPAERMGLRRGPAPRGGQPAGPDEDRLFLQVHAPAEKGKANQAVIRALAKALGVRRSAITIETGLTAPIKRIAVDGIAPSTYDAFLKRLKRSDKTG